MRAARAINASSPKPMDLLPISTCPASKRMRAFGTFHFFAAKSVRRVLIILAACFAAMPFKSAPEDAAVAEVLGTLAVVVAVMRTSLTSMPKTSATTCATLV